MTDKLTKDGNPIDKTSQRVLQHLHSLRCEEVPTATSSDLRDACGIDNSQNITYRVNTHLAPANLVTWVEEDATGAAGSRRHYSITEDGAEWVENHADDIARPADLDDTADAAQQARETARQALDEATSAKKSVQNYRTKVARLKTRVTGREDPDYDGYWDKKGHEQRIEDLEDQQATITERVNQKAGAQQAADADLRSEQNADRIDEINESVNDINDRLDELEHRIDDQPVQDDIDAIRDRLSDVDSNQDELSSWFQSIEVRLSDVEQKQSEGLLRRLLPFL